MSEDELSDLNALMKSSNHGGQTLVVPPNAFEESVEALVKASFLLTNERNLIVGAHMDPQDAANILLAGLRTTLNANVIVGERTEEEKAAWQAEAKARAEEIIKKLGLQ